MKEIRKIEKELLDAVFNHFKGSKDCKGLASYNLNIDAPEKSLIAAIKKLIKADKISLLSAEHDANPHIVRFGFVPPKEQISFLQRNGFAKSFCLYPSANYLIENVKPEFTPKYPFLYMLQTGCPQYKACYFEWGVLYKYFSDPRYKFHFSDYLGKIESTKDINEESYINLQTFGVGKDADGFRVVVAFPKDLIKMSSASQIEWHSKMVPNQEQCKILKSYEKNLFEGCWDFPQTVFRSLLQEMTNINQLTNKIWNVALFREEFEDKPVDFDMIYIPTRKAYMDYVLLLEKIVVSNINESFFDTINWPRSDQDGRAKGTLRCLKEFLQKVNPDVEIEITSPLREVRKQRQNPAHKIEVNFYYLEFMNQQHELTVQVFNSLNLLRKLLQTHPKGRGLEIKFNNTEKYIIP